MSRNSVSSSCLNDSGAVGSTITRVSRATSSMPSSRSKRPGAVLLGQQPALQPVGQARDHVGEAGQLLVEVGAQPRQLLGVAQLLGDDDLVVVRW